VVGKDTIDPAPLFDRKHPDYEALDQRDQPSPLPASVERSVEFLLCVAQLGVGFEDDGAVVEKLDARAVRKCLGAEVDDVGERVQYPEAQAHLSPHSNLLVVEQVGMQDVVGLNGSPDRGPPVAEQQKNDVHPFVHCLLLDH